MTSKRLMGIGDSIMKLKNRNLSTNNLSSMLDLSAKTSSTYASPKKSNIKQMIDSYSLRKKIFSNPAKLLTDSYLNISKNNLNISNKYNNKPTNYIYTFSNNKSNELIDNADQILKERKNNHLIIRQLEKNTYMKKTEEIRLDNYKIKILKNKRNEINTKILDIKNAIRTTEKIYEKDYNNFYKFVEKNDKSQKNQEYILNKYKKLADDKEIEYNKLVIQNKKLKHDIELLVKKILVLKNYGSFIHHVFKTDFEYENIIKLEDKNYLNIGDQLIKIYDKNNDKNIDNKLSDEYWLIVQLKEYEQNIINILNERELHQKNFIKSENEDKNDITQLINKKKQLEKDLELYKDINNQYIKSSNLYEYPEIVNNALDYISELSELLGLNNIFLKDKNDKNVIDYTNICADLIKIINKKEIDINNLIKEIENVVDGENYEDKLLIETIILKRKKHIKNEKLAELMKLKKDEMTKKNIKGFKKANRIVFKGRKVIDFPFIKIKKRKKKIIPENHDNEYLCYSSDEEENK